VSPRRHPTRRSRAGATRPKRRALGIDQAGDRRRRHGRAPRQRRRTSVLGAGHGSGWPGWRIRGRPKPLWNAASKASANSQAAGLSQGDSAGSGSGVRNKTGITVSNRDQGHCPSPGPWPPLAEPVCPGLELLQEKGGWLLGRGGFGGRA